MALLWAENTELNLSGQFQNGTAPILPFSPYYAMVNSHAPIDALPSESFLRLSSGVFGAQSTLPSITSPLTFVTTPPRIRINHHPEPAEIPIARHHDLPANQDAEGQSVDRSTDSVSRGFSDLDFPKFVFAVAALTAARTVVSQPLCVALTKKQACAEFASRSTLSIMRQTYRTEGLRRGLLRGCLAMALGQIATDVITFGVFEYLREYFANTQKESNNSESSTSSSVGSSTSVEANGQNNLTTFLSGYTGDAICQAVRIPFLVIGIRQIMDSSASPANIRQTTQQLYKAGGFRALYAGLGTTLLVGSQWTGLWWLVYGVSKDTLYTGYRGWLGVEESDSAAQRMEKARRKFSSKLIPSWAIHTEDNGTINSLASCFTSASTAVVFNPYLVIRTRLQAEVGSTILSVTRQVFREAGIRGFFHGTVLNINACIFDAWLASTTYEWAKLYADKSNA